MTPLGDLRRHFLLVKGMAKATDTDVEGAYAAGRLDQDEWAEMVQACRGCQWTEGCEAWLAGGQGAAVAPKPCCNRARLAMLRLEEELAG